jgi:hypothetical protein
VEVAKAHVIAVGHGSEEGVMGPGEISGNVREVVHQDCELVEVAGKLDGSSAVSLLIHLCHSLYTLRPRNGRPQSDALEKFAGIGRTEGRRWDLATVNLISITQMTNHLMDGHFPPEAVAVGTKFFQPREDFILIARVSQALHITNLWSLKSIFAPEF